MAKSKVYFMKAEEAKLSKLIDESRIFDFIGKGNKVAVKMHFGEKGNTGHVKPEYAGIVCRKLIEKGTVPFLSDTNALYRGGRTNSADHIKLAREHGFTKKACGADLVIPDDTNKGSVSDVAIDGKFFKNAKVASVFLKADAIVGLAHFKGHIMTGFGGAVKNIGMGCASREGKLAQHSELTPMIRVKDCTNCLKCVEECPVDAISSRDAHAVIDPDKCIGCATCIAVCPQSAIDVNWESGGKNLQEKMVEYAGAVLKAKKGRLAFINFATKITKECDCLAKDDPGIAPDIGIFASLDPVSIDKACYDRVVAVCGKDIFEEAHPGRDALKQLRYASSLGLGGLDYELVEL